MNEAAIMHVHDDDLWWFIDHALDEMIAIVIDLGDVNANVAPSLHGANSAYAILTHCVGVMEYWGGRMVAGRAITRDRPAEFTASGPVGGLLDRAANARTQLRSDLAALDGAAPTAQAPSHGVEDLPYGKSQAGVVLHIVEELYQHLGQMELTRDIVMARHGRC